MVRGLPQNLQNKRQVAVPCIIHHKKANTVPDRPFWVLEATYSSRTLLQPTYLVM